jgi:Xaa-Pro aminopeptidase
MRQALEIAEVGINAGRQAIGEGVKESEIAGEIARSLFAAGCDALLSHPQISTDPLRRMATDRRIRNGDLVLIDLNIGYNGYVGDVARTYSVGTPTAEQKRTFKVQLECLQRAMSLIKPGAPVTDIHNGVREVVETAGLEESWHHYITGHGLGTCVGPNEQPTIASTPGPTKELKAGMVIALEPGFFRTGVGPVRNEDVVLVTETGYEQLTRLSYDARLSE